MNSGARWSQDLASVWGRAHLQVGLQGRMVALCFSSEDAPLCFPWHLHRLHSNQQCTKVSISPRPLQHLFCSEVALPQWEWPLTVVWLASSRQWRYLFGHFVSVLKSSLEECLEGRGGRGLPRQASALSAVTQALPAVVWCGHVCTCIRLYI